MAEPVATEQPDNVSAATGAGKRKRVASANTTTDNRPVKRAPPATMSANTESNHAFDPMDVAQAAIADLSALQQATAADHHSEASDPANASSTAAAALGSIYPSIHDMPPSNEDQYGGPNSADGDHPQSSYPPPPSADGPHPDSMPMEPADVPYHHPPRHDSRPTPKPSVGSQEWHQMRKDNHKEVERRRRETINEGINELSKIVPGCEKNKGSILQRAVSYIMQLKETEQQNIEKWTLEKLLTEQALTELQNSNDKLKHECERLYRELETWKRVAKNAGVHPPQPKEDATTSNGAGTPPPATGNAD
jgi:hypothetical protein